MKSNCGSAGPRTAESLPSLPPVTMPQGQPSMLVRGSCYRLNVTLYFNPAASDIYLDAAAGTSGEIAQAVQNACLAEGLQVVTWAQAC